MSRAAALAFLLFLVPMIGILFYQNVIADDLAVRQAADRALEDACYRCNRSSIRGGRGMIDATFEYGAAGEERHVVRCRRELIAIGSYECKVIEGTVEDHRFQARGEESGGDEFGVKARERELARQRESEAAGDAAAATPPP